MCVSFRSGGLSIFAVSSVCALCLLWFSVWKFGDNRCTALHASLLATSTCTPIMTIAKNHGLHPDMMFTLHAVV